MKGPLKDMIALQLEKFRSSLARIPTVVSKLIVPMSIFFADADSKSSNHDVNAPNPVKKCKVDENVPILLTIRSKKFSSLDTQFVVKTSAAIILLVAI